MKKFFQSMMLVAVAAMGLAACTTEEDTNITAEKQTKTIKVISEITRTEFDDARTQLIWSDGDTIGVYTDEGDVNVQSTTYPEEFTVKVDQDATEVYAYYPYYDGNKDKTSNKMSVGIKGTIEQSKPGKITTLGAVPLIGVGTIVDDTVSITFESYACILALNVYGGESTTEKVKSIKFTGDKKSSGFDYNFNIENCDASTYTPAYDYTLVKLTGDAQFTPNGAKPAVASEFANAVFMPVAKQTYDAGSVFEVTTTEKTYTFTATSAINCDQGYATLNLNLAKADKPNVDEGDIADGKYIIVVKSGNDYIAMAGTNIAAKRRKDSVTITSIFDTNDINTNDETLIWTITNRAEGGYYFTYGGKHLYGSASDNIAKTGDDNNYITLSDNGDNTYKIASSAASERLLGLNVASKGFAFYKNTTINRSPDDYPSNFYIVPATYVTTPRITVDNNAVTVSSTANNGTVGVTITNTTYDKVNVSSSASWLKAELTNNTTLSFAVEANSGVERSATVTLSAGDATATITFTQNAYVEVDPSKAKTYTFTITKEDFNTTSYAANNNTKTSVAKASDGSEIEVEWTSNQVMQQNSTMQWQKNKGYIYNVTDLGTIDEIKINSTSGTFTTYIGSSTQPTSNGEGGYFKIKVGNDATGKVNSVTITFTK
jgi:hypothetical protein